MPLLNIVVGVYIESLDVLRRNYSKTPPENKDRKTESCTPYAILETIASS